MGQTGYYVGIDIGSVSTKAAVVVVGAHGSVKASCGFTALPASNGDETRIYTSLCLRTRGKPLSVARELLEKIFEAFGCEITSLCLTGGGSQLVAAKLDATVINEFKAAAAGLGGIGVTARTVFEMGGQSSKYLLLEHNGATYDIMDYATNGDCAAGTGSFIDQQAGRLKYEVHQIGPLVLASERAAQIAGRCSVFAKSDMIHAQQKGYTPAEVLGGLCDAVARNFRTAVVKSHPVESPVVMIGGMASNEAVVRAIRQTFSLDESQFFVPQAFRHISAIGAAVVASQTTSPKKFCHTHTLPSESDTGADEFATAPPLSMENVVLLRNRVGTYSSEITSRKIDSYMGIDIGSVSTNVVIIDRSGNVLSEIYTPTRGRPIEVVTQALQQIERQWSDRLNIRGVGTTGSGRELIGELVGADTVNDEITAHKTGATFVGKQLLDGKIPDTIFEIGGQDSKYICLQDGVVIDFTMNDACAAGTGSFLEERAEELGISIKDQFAELALSSKSPIRLGERCTVFMERDVSSYMQRGARKTDIVAGLAYSVVHNYINRVVRGRKIGDCIFFQGGTAYNDAVAAAFAAVCKKQIIVPPHNGVIGAIGSALLAIDKIKTNSTKSRFRGYDVSKVNYSLRDFVCKGCSNACQVQEFNVEGQKTYWGDKCSDKYRKPVKTTQKPVIEDLSALRNKLLLDESHLPEVPPNAPTVGIPLTMFAIQTLPFWRTFFASCGFKTVLSDPTNKQTIRAGLAAVVAEPCFPIIVAHGHVADLAEKNTDYIFLPSIISSETTWMQTESYLCPWHQTLAFVCRRSPALKPCAEKFLTPTLHFRLGRKHIQKELIGYFSKGGHFRATKPKQIARATELAFQAQDEFNRKIISAGKKALAQLDEAGAEGIVLLGRPYNVHDAGVNLSIAAKLRNQYGVNCIGQDFLDVDSQDIRPTHPNMFWDLGRRIIAAAQIVAQHPRLHVIYITNFKCGPDSFLTNFVRPTLGKPFLTLQFDGHSNDAGIMTRCEAYLDSKGILRSKQNRIPTDSSCTLEGAAVE